MALSLPRRHTSRGTLPFIFEKKKQTWPDPEASVGQECLKINGRQCWQVIGPALAVMETLSVPIKELLDKNQELLEQGESKSRPLSFQMWMLGQDHHTAVPTIVFCSKSKRQRTCAKALLKESGLLNDYPGIEIKALDKVPAVYRSAKQSPNTTSEDAFEAGIFMFERSCEPRGALISVGHARTATMGGVLLINGSYYGITAQHAQFDPLGLEDDVDDDEDLCFDDDSDSDSDSELQTSIEMTSKGSVSSFTDDETSGDSFSSLSVDSLFDKPSKLQPQKHDHRRSRFQELIERRQNSSGWRISSLPVTCIENDLDYEVFPLDDQQLHLPNRIQLPETQGSTPSFITPNGFVRELQECEIWAATGTTGSVKGTILKTPFYTKLEHSQTFQEMWTVRLDRKTMHGDCGAWVVEASTGRICGHIVAGCPITGLAFIIPAYKVFDDIERRFRTRPLLSMETEMSSSHSLKFPPESRELTPVLLAPQEAFTVIMAWLFWCSWNPCFSVEFRREIVSSILSSTRLRKCLGSL